MILGKEGVSLCFLIGMLKLNEDLDSTRKKVIELQKSVAEDEYYREIPSVIKVKQKQGFYFHAKNDIPEIRKTFYDFIKTLDCSFEAVVGRKIPSIYEKKHNMQGSEFYADLLSHLLKNKLHSDTKLILNIAQRQNSTENKNLETALRNAIQRFNKKYPGKEIKKEVVFNVQNQISEPLLNIADYFCWSVQRVFERGEMRYYNYICDKISLILDLYDKENWSDSGNYYKNNKPLTIKNKLSPPVY